MMGRKRARKRRLAICAVFALAVAVGAPLIAPSAGAVIANPGEIQMSLDLSIYTPTFTLAGMATNGSGPAQMGKNGLITIPKSTLDFEPVNVSIDLPPAVDTSTTGDPSTTSTNPPSTAPVPTTATVRAVPMGDFLAGIDPRSGAGILIGEIQELWSVPGRMTDCPVGPFRIQAGTTTSGSVLYSVKTGTVSVVDPGFTIGAIPTGASGCAGLEASVNSALSLPVTTTTTTTRPGATTTTLPLTDTPPVPSIVATMTFTPAPRALPPAPVKHRPPPVVHSTTTTTTPEVVAPKPTAAKPTPTGHRNQRRRQVQRNNGNRGRNQPQQIKQIKRRIAPKLLTHSGIKPKPGHKQKRAAAAAHKKAAPKPAASGADAIQPDLVPASFIKRPQSALSTGLDLLGLLGLLVFSSLALWLVTSELTDFSASNKKLRTHRIAGISRR